MRPHDRLILAAFALLASASASSGQVLRAPDQTWQQGKTPVHYRVSTAPGSPIDQSRAPAVTRRTLPAFAVPTGRLPARGTILLPNETFVEGIAIDWDALNLFEPFAPEPILFPLPEGGFIELAMQTGEWHGPRSFTALGQIAGVANSSVILCVHEDSVRMYVQNHNLHGRNFTIRSASGGGHLLAELDVNDAEICAGCASGVHIKPAPNAPSTHTRLSAFDDINVLDVLIVASDQARAIYATPNAFTADAMAMIADMNIRLSTSGQGLRVRLSDADWDLIAGYTEYGGSNLELDLREIAYPVGTAFLDGHVNTKAAADAVLTQRDLYRPDVVHLITLTGTGVGYAPGQPSELNPGYGFAVSSLLAAVPNGTFAHEVGHNLGACHNANASAPACAAGLNGTERGIERYCDLTDFIVSDDHEVRTTMAYAVNTTVPSTRLQRYSVNGLQYVGDNVISTCTLNMWAANAQVALTMEFTKPVATQYNIASSQMWAKAGAAGNVGTRFAPFGSIGSAVNAVQGDLGEATVRANGGTYSAGGGMVLNKAVTIKAVGGPVVIE